MADHHPLIFTFGILGNIISILMFLSPMPTFLRVYKKKSTEGFQSIPYVVALFSCMLWIYYAMLKPDDFLLLSINSIGCLVESIYILLYIFYAPKKARILTFQMLFLMNFAGFLAIVGLTNFLAKGSSKLQIVGWFCVAISVVLFAAPLSVIRLVIRTKSVEFMPFSLTICLTLCAVMWLLYGILRKDMYVAIPNIFGLVLGGIQIVVYAIYKVDGKKDVEQQQNPLERMAIESHTVLLVSLPADGNNNDQVHKNEDSDEPRKPINGEAVESLNQVQPVDQTIV